MNLSQAQELFFIHVRKLLHMRGSTTGFYSYAALDLLQALTSSNEADMEERTLFSGLL